MTAAAAAKPTRLGRLIGLFQGRQDLVLVVLLMFAVVMIVFPLPTAVLDVLIAANIGFGVLMLLTAVYLSRPVAFSTLPSVILIATLFRLSISISTTRLILLEADAGHIVEAFGAFVVGGSLIVGLVMFLIITVAQFVVITKGAERVAEVGARFSLDALPGKQMSIDSDARSGEIDIAEASRRRTLLGRESEFYGAMDGTMKFVKGDAIATLLITFVNLVGGIAVGTLEHDMTLAEAAHRFSVLTIGDGLIAQIPALLISVASGIIVTRVASEDAGNLGTDIAQQIGAEPIALRLSGGIVMAMALVPGFPPLVFLALGTMLFGAGMLLRRRPDGTPQGMRPRKGLALGGELADEIAIEPSATATLLLSDALARDLDGPALRAAVRDLRAALLDDYGVPFPTLRLAALAGPGAALQIRVEDIPVLAASLPAGHLLVREPVEHLEILGLTPVAAPDPGRGAEGAWVDLRHRPQLDAAGIAYLDPVQVIAAAVRRAMAEQVAQFVGVQETRAILEGMEPRYPDLVREAQKHVPLQRTADVLRRLVEEGVSVRNMRIVLEALVEWGHREKDPVLLAEYVRIALRRQICHRHGDANRLIPVFLLAPGLEEAVRTAVRHTSVGAFLALDPDVAERLVGRVREVSAAALAQGGQPVVLAAMDVRRHLRGFLHSHGIALPVLAHQELAPEFNVLPLATVSL